MSLKAFVRLGVTAAAAVSLVLSAVPAGASAADLDNDRLTDRWDASFGLSTARANAHRDADRDGLTNRREFRAKTNPKQEDTDGDGVEDGVELMNATDPLDVDADGDGVVDGDEDVNDDGTADEDADDAKESCKADDEDADGDGLDNEDENDLSLDPVDADTDSDGELDGLEDADGDDTSNLEEEEESSDRCSNHGAAVSTVAKCPVKGRAHGVLVSTIARNKEATVEDAVAACAAALAAQQPVEEVPGSGEGEDVDETTDETDATDETGAGDGTQADGHGTDATEDPAA